MKYFAIFLTALLMSCSSDNPKLITESGIGAITFDSGLESIYSLGFRNIEKEMYETPSGEPYMGMVMYINDTEFISLEADAESGEIYKVNTNSTDYSTHHNLKVGNSFKELLLKYPNQVEFLDGEGGEIVVHVRASNMLIHFNELEFKDGVYYSDLNYADTDNILRNTIDRNALVTFISVVKYSLPHYYLID